MVWLLVEFGWWYLDGLARLVAGLGCPNGGTSGWVTMHLPGLLVFQQVMVQTQTSQVGCRGLFTSWPV
jgi:hypothetical protein